MTFKDRSGISLIEMRDIFPEKELVIGVPGPYRMPGFRQDYIEVEGKSVPAGMSTIRCWVIIWNQRFARRQYTIKAVTEGETIRDVELEADGVAVPEGNPIEYASYDETLAVCLDLDVVDKIHEA